MANYRLIPNEEKYWEFIRILRTTDGIAQGFIEQGNISPIKQKEYMIKYNHCFRICLDESNPVGYVGIIDDDIRVATHPDHQGKGIGSFMINEVMKDTPSAVAKVKIDNKASLKLFEKCGFKLKYYLLERE
tara:strand:- start:279 stop:671 length:393 start_codon:yes stop_codon:yes gene_type:complete